MPSYVEIVAYLVFGSFAAAAVCSFGLLAWSVWRLRSPASKVVLPAQLPSASELILRPSPLRVAAIWISLLLLLPLLALAIWAVAVELSARRVGLGLAFAAIHSWLRTTVRTLTPGARWTAEQRGMIG